MTWKLTSAFFVIMMLLSGNVEAHQIVGEVTPLMIRMELMLKFIDNGSGDKALLLAGNTYNDFMDPATGNEEWGLKHNSLRIDQKFGTDVQSIISVSIKQKDTERLETGLRLLSFLLMLEKYDALESTFGNANSKISAQKTMFWLGRNYFSYLLEPVLAREDPVEEKRLDRLLDKMLYRIEDREWDEFRLIREELIKGISEYFNMSQFIHLTQHTDN